MKTIAAFLLLFLPSFSGVSTGLSEVFASERGAQNLSNELGACDTCWSTQDLDSMLQISRFLTFIQYKYEMMQGFHRSYSSPDPENLDFVTRNMDSCATDIRADKILTNLSEITPITFVMTSVLIEYPARRFIIGWGPGGGVYYIRGFDKDDFWRMVELEDLDCQDSVVMKGLIKVYVEASWASPDLTVAQRIDYDGLIGGDTARYTAVSSEMEGFPVVRHRFTFNDCRMLLHEIDTVSR